jgi:hypothetical protein
MGIVGFRCVAKSLAPTKRIWTHGTQGNLGRNPPQADRAAMAACGEGVGESRYAVYEAAKRHEIEVFEIGSRKLAITAPLRRKLGLEGEVA